MQNEIIQAAVYQNLTFANRLQNGSQILFRLTGVAFDYLRPNGEEMVLGDAGVRHPVCEAERLRNGGWEACAACESRHLALAIERKSLQLYRCPARLNRLVLPVFTPAGVYVGALRTRGFELGGEPGRISDRPVLNESRLAGVIAYLEQQTRILLEYQWQFESEETATASSLRFESVTAYIRKNCMKELTPPAAPKLNSGAVSSAACRPSRSGRYSLRARNTAANTEPASSGIHALVKKSIHPVSSLSHRNPAGATISASDGSSTPAAQPVHPAGRSSGGRVRIAAVSNRPGNALSWASQPQPNSSQ